MRGDSILSVALRSLCQSAAKIVGFGIGFLIILFCMSVLSNSRYDQNRVEYKIAPDEHGEREEISSSSPVILKMDIRGVIGVADLTSEKISNLLISSRENPFKQDRVKAILLHIDSPGGSATDSDGIYRMLKEYKEKFHVPIYAYIDGMCASGGLYIACAADAVYATAGSVIGSVGVVTGPFFNFSDTMSEYGVRSVTLTRGKDKDFLNPFRPWKANEEEESVLKPVLDSLYDRFVSIVLNGRTKVSREKLVGEYGAHVFPAQKAEEIGYIDHSDANYSACLSELVSAAQIDGKYQVVQLGSYHNLIDGFSSNSKGMLLNWLGLPPEATSSELRGKFLYIYPL